MTKELTIGEQLDNKVLAVIGSEKLAGFQRAFGLATATQELKALLDAQYMVPIMALQGTRLGFRTDKDSSGGYPIPVVKNCLIEAVLTGLEPCGNQFNIIAGNMYVTKEGFKHLLDGLNEFSYELITELPKISADNKSAAVDVKLFWNFKGQEGQERTIQIPIRVNGGMGVDAILGKATRKARAWLYNNVSGTDIGDGDVSEQPVATVDVEHQVVDEETGTDSRETKRILHFIGNADTLDELEILKNSVGELKGELLKAYNDKETEIKTPKK